MKRSFSVLALLAGLVHGQFPSPPNDLEVIVSTLNPDVKLSYKQVQPELCETTPGVNTFSGYVHLPQSALSDISFNFDINTYFLYFDARNDPENAPLVIYLAGGPGESSTFTAMSSEGGPCYVNLDGNSTTLNPWSLNNDANMLYIDQPVGAGFSYTTLVNATYDLLNNAIKPLSDYDGDIPENSLIFGQGTYTNPTVWATTNTTVSTARALRHFAEHWLTQFPEYKSNNKKIGVWGNSAGGLWAPATAAELDKKIKSSDPGSPLHEWSVDNLGITDGVIDWGHDMPFWPEFAYNNTYKPFITEEVYESAALNFTKPDGCRDLIEQCRAAAREGDPDGRGTNATVSTLCSNATNDCFLEVGTPILSAGRSAFDIAVSTASTGGTDPCSYYLPVVNYLNQDWTQKALGVPLNFTYISDAVLRSYTTSDTNFFQGGTGDAFRANSTPIEYALQNDIKVALVYGDRDARCPWIAAEDYSLHANYPWVDSFNQAGYEYITTNDKYQGGVVRQSGKLSFSRVFQAGHAVNAYQPETVSRIFHRTLFDTDVATGIKNASGGYSSHGPASSLGMYNGTLPDAPPTCMVLGAFQDTNPWTPIFALVAEQGNAGNGPGNGSEGGPGSNSGTSGNGTSSSMSARLQPGGALAISLFVAIGLGTVAL
ncbi:hypothetical protein H2200_011306 [Cladophialophora chaetospira]|uniref:Uncharacterized protein n=1 Tax=Cladophialophora chaetospira TaxID=386627 RepID=A0AA38X0E2_9EURO|nr:hypothetical protein H2200_011306 [Cladophialophora chaetospira]